MPDAGRVWHELHQMAPETGLVPITLASLGDQGSGTYGDQPGLRGRPWDSGELGNPYPLADADGVDVPALLAEYWEDSVEPGEDDPELLVMLGPFGREFPGLAPASDGPLSDEELAAALRLTRPARLGLVPASRPADVLSLTGFAGLTTGGTPAEFTAVLRGWEERFGAVLYEVGFADVRLGWLQHGAATSYGTPSPAQAAQIAALLATGNLTRRQCREIAFAAGVPMPAAGSHGQPPCHDEGPARQ